MKCHRTIAETILLFSLAAFSLIGQQAVVCTGITFEAKDGSVVFGRTME